MQKIHVTVYFNQDIADVFSAVSDHRSFLTGGGLTCHLIKKGAVNKNGLGAVRTVRTKTHTFTEEINAFEENESFDYLITAIKPKMAMKHHAGWLEFNEENGKTRVDWHSHFTITTPIIGPLIGWVVKRKIEKVFLNRLNQLK
ncbi:SRPBCC family protein [Marinicella litoralis]|uniref:Polyketide cyclase/dehydrase/lipid transport protein n=1 Tax=Marinicella litoralis TaxID=644220 RepID=A0A4V3DIK0_9GAMM|nr:SRPBCC family protein [Marinicella litoralis]TDR22401.1 polyketide cyclase/dehydrase/lipid transport protein [Marinicella litoralis]